MIEHDELVLVSITLSINALEMFRVMETYNDITSFFGLCQSETEKNLTHVVLYIRTTPSNATRLKLIYDYT